MARLSNKMEHEVDAVNGHTKLISLGLVQYIHFEASA